MLLQLKPMLHAAVQMLAVSHVAMQMLVVLDAAVHSVHAVSCVPGQGPA